MPRGGRRIGAGRPRKPDNLHWLHGTGPRSVMATATAPAIGMALETIPDVITAGLGEAGQRFVEEQWREAEWTGADALLLRQAARALDDSEGAPSPRERRLAIRLFAALVEQLQRRKG